MLEVLALAHASAALDAHLPATTKPARPAPLYDRTIMRIASRASATHVTTP
jgi:hypothetical protein